MQNTTWSARLQSLYELHCEEEAASNGVAVALRPGTPATEADTRASENAIGARFHPQHIQFLQHANGWDRFSGNIDLFGTHDFVGSERFLQAKEWVTQMDRRVLGRYAKHRKSLLPVGKSSVSTDLFLMRTDRGQVQATVLWFTNELIEEFPDFNSMFSTISENMRQVIEYWLQRTQRNLPSGEA